MNAQAKTNSTQSPNLRDLAANLGYVACSIEQLAKLALDHLPSDTDSDKSRVCLDAALRYIDDLHSIHNAIDELSLLNGGSA